MKNRIAFYTFGCRLNQSETAVIERSFEQKGYSIVGFDDNPDIVVVNTCTVTENGDADTRQLVKKINRLNPQARIALVGCQAQIQKEKLAKLPNVRWVVGNAKKMDLAEIIDETGESLLPQVIAPTIPRDSFQSTIAGIDKNHTRANLKIQDGCDFFCSFCEIPYARGRARSRDFGNILWEAGELARAGHKEIILTGINIGTFANNGKTISDVCDALETISGIERIRISSIEPTTIPFELIERMGKSKLCRHLHIPLQSGSNEILKSMRRKYTTEEFFDFVLKAHKTVPQVSIGTDIIVGFPGETDEHFQETEEFVRNLPLSYLHVFRYSARYVAKSRSFPNPVSPKVIKKRSELLRSLGHRKRQLFMEKFIGTVQNVLWEDEHDGLWSGLTDNYLRIKALSKKSLANTFRPVYLQHIDQHCLTGQLQAAIPSQKILKNDSFASISAYNQNKGGESRFR